MSEETKFDMAKRVHTEKFGNTERYSFSKIKNVLEIPNLISIQKNSYNDFIQNGIKEVLQYYSPIVSQNGKLKLTFLSHELSDKPKNPIQYCKDNALNYEASLHVLCQLENTETMEIQKPESVYLGDIPLMTDSGSFIINGAERVVVSQLITHPRQTITCMRRWTSTGIISSILKLRSMVMFVETR